MNKLEEAREIINEVDKEIVSLFERRMAAVKMVYEYKKENHMEILDSSREASVIEKNKALLTNASLEEYYVEFLKEMMNISKQYQSDLMKGK